VPRPSSVDRAIEELDGHGGVALLGADGVGKTTLAEQIAEKLGEKSPVRVVGTATQACVPFGAFGALVQITEVGKPAALIRSALDSLLAQADNAVIVVDDAHLLDPLSATLVYQLAQQPGVRLIVTARSTSQLPGAVAALWEDGLLGRVDVALMSGEETAAVLAALPEPITDVQLYRRSAGNPLHLRLLVESGGSSDRSLSALLDDRLGALAAPVREVLGYLAVQEPMARTDLSALTSEAAVEQAEAAGVVQQLGTEVYGAHPLLVERAVVAADPADAQRRRTEVAGLLVARPARHLGDRLGRALLALDSDAPDSVDDVVAAAQEALRLGDLVLSERLASSALERTERFDARLALSYALAWQGRGREADSVLAAVDAGALSEDQVMAWALPRAANQFWMLSEPERATAFLQNTRKRVSTTAARLTLDALSATFAMNAGNVARAVEIATDVLAAPDAEDMAVAWAASAAALSSARMGRFDEVAPLADRAVGAEHPGLLRFTVGLAQTTTLLMSGQADAAEEVARHFTDFAELAQPGRAIGEVLLAGVLLAKGDPGAATQLLGPAAATLELTGYSWGALSLMYLATALSQQGKIAEASMTLSRAESRHGTKSALFTPELGVARAWRLAMLGDDHGAVAAARDAARAAERSGQAAVAAWAWHQAARLGDLRAADPLAKLAQSVDCAFIRSAIEDAQAVK